MCSVTLQLRTAQCQLEPIEEKSRKRIDQAWLVHMIQMHVKMRQAERAHRTLGEETGHSRQGCLHNTIPQKGVLFTSHRIAGDGRQQELNNPPVVTIVCSRAREFGVRRPVQDQFSEAGDPSMWGMCDMCTSETALLLMMSEQPH